MCSHTIQYACKQKGGEHDEETGKEVRHKGKHEQSYRFFGAFPSDYGNHSRMWNHDQFHVKQGIKNTINY